jgi:hypothetical protein
MYGWGVAFLLRPNANHLGQLKICRADMPESPLIVRHKLVSQDQGEPDYAGPYKPAAVAARPSVERWRDEGHGG